MSSALFEVEGPLQTVGVSLLPLGWHALTGLDASEYVDSLFDAADLNPEFAELENTLRLIDDPQVGVDRLWDFLRRHFRRVNSAHRAFVEATGQWLSGDGSPRRSEEHTSELQSLMRISYAVFCLKNKNMH